MQKISYWLYSYSQYAQIQHLKKLKGVEISPSFSFGMHSTIVLRGENNQLIINDRVRCKRFCSYVVYPNASLIIEKGVFFNNNCSVNCLGNIQIGENTLFGEGVKLYDHNHAHTLENGKLKVFPDDYRIGYIKIGKNCWIGSNVIILKNVEIGDNVIIGANCLIHRSVPSNTIVKSAAPLDYTDLN